MNWNICTFLIFFWKPLYKNSKDLKFWGILYWKQYGIFTFDLIRFWPPGIAFRYIYLYILVCRDTINSMLLHECTTYLPTIKQIYSKFFIKMKHLCLDLIHRRFYCIHPQTCHSCCIVLNVWSSPQGSLV